MTQPPEPNDPPNPPPNPDPPPAPDPPAPHHECTALIAELNTRVESLENQLQAVIQLKPDSSPVKGPWTHRKLGG